MAGASVIFLTGTFTTAAGSKSVTATPQVGDALLLITAHTNNISLTQPTDDAGGAYTAFQSALKATNVDRMSLFVRTGLAPTATPITFTHNPTGTTSGGGLFLVAIRGLNADLAYINTARQSNQAAGGTPAPIITGSTINVLNPVIGVVFNADNPAGLSPRSSPAYSELTDVGYNVPSAGLEIMAINSGESSQTITWGSVSVGAFCSIVIEIDSSIPAAHGKFFAMF